MHEPATLLLTAAPLPPSQKRVPAATVLGGRKGRAWLAAPFLALAGLAVLRALRRRSRGAARGGPEETPASPATSPPLPSDPDLARDDLLRQLKRNGNEHLLQGWDALDAEGRAALVADIGACPRALPTPPPRCCPRRPGGLAQRRVV